MKIGFVGAGGIASRHLKNLSEEPNVQIVAICDIDLEKAKGAADTYGAIAYTDIVEMFEQTELDAVFICTPAGFRRQPVEEAATRGIACFIEKPPAAEMGEAERIKEVIEQAGIINAVGFMYRYSGAVQKAKQLIAGMPIAIVRSVYVCDVALHRKIPAWFFNKAISGGPVFDQAIHMLDASRYLVAETGGEIVEIHSFGSNLTAPKTAEFTVEDSHVINIAYEKGTIQNHTHSWAISENQVKIELISKDYGLLIDLSPRPERSGSRLTGTLHGEPVDYSFTDENFYVTEIRTFLQAVATKDQSLIHSSFADATHTLQAVLTANQSVDEKRSIPLQ